MLRQEKPASVCSQSSAVRENVTRNNNLVEQYKSSERVAVRILIHTNSIPTTKENWSTDWFPI